MDSTSQVDTFADQSAEGCPAWGTYQGYTWRCKWKRNSERNPHDIAGVVRRFVIVNPYLPLGKMIFPAIGEERRSFTSVDDLLANCNTLTSAARFEQVRTFRHWLLPILRTAITKWAEFSCPQIWSLREQSSHGRHQAAGSFAHLWHCNWASGIC